ncbi:tetratricopeptide repeat protein [Novipirellula aureliae]|nr:tetratricopeptide repeat protein [Novipirellula aureliae]
MLMTLVGMQTASAKEPANAFIKQLRADGYFDMTIVYLDRLSSYPGVDDSLLQAVELEKAQVYIDAAVASRSVSDRDDYFAKAESSLSRFLENQSHPRLSEARLQLGKLQMVRGNQLEMLDTISANKEKARQSYVAAAETFQTIVDDLREKLKTMRGQSDDDKIDPGLRDRYRGEFLQAKRNTAEARRLAAMTYADPAKDGRQLLEEAIAEFEDLTKNYDGFVTGALALVNLGQSYDALGQAEKAKDCYLRMLEQPEDDDLREAKFQSATGLIRMAMSESPPNYAAAIERAAVLVQDVRPNEVGLQSLASLKLELAKAYLAKAADKENLKKAETNIAESDGRKLLNEIVKVPGTHLEESQELLRSLGIKVAEVKIPKVEDPKNFDDALEAARQLLQVSETTKQALELIERQGGDGPDLQTQKAELNQQWKNSIVVAIEILKRGITMVDASTDLSQLGEARQILAYLLYQEKQYRDAAAVGSFIAQTLPGTELGQQGGMIALNSFQMLLSEVPEAQIPNLIGRIRDFADSLGDGWPDDSLASAARGIMVQLALRNNEFDRSKELIEEMDAGPERARFERLLGRIYWNASVVAKREGDEGEAEKQLKEADRFLVAGLDGIGNAEIESEVLQAALVLAKVRLRQGKGSQALTVLENASYGPLKRRDEVAAQDDAFRGNLAALELNIVVSQMTSPNADLDALMKRATEVMEKLQATFNDAEGQKRLAGIYAEMATELQSELESTSGEKKTQLIEAFRVFLSRIAATTQNPTRLKWIIQTLVQLGESAMPAKAIKAEGQAAELLSSAVQTSKKLQASGEESSLAIQFQLGRAQRLLGNYKDALDIFTAILTEKPTMLDAQVEAATAYENWALILPDRFKPKAYEAALFGARKGSDNKNILWGWGKISSLANRNQQFEETFFLARYHIALSRFLWGRAAKDPKLFKRAEQDIVQVQALYPDLGGDQHKQKFEALLRQIQKEIGK